MGTHREVLINYGKIDDAIKRTGTYIASLDRIESVVDESSRLLEDQEGEAFVMLEDRRVVLKKTIATRRGQAQDLLTSLTNYRNDMEALIHPVSRGIDVRVRRDDIGFNLWQIDTDVQGVYQTRYQPPQQTNPYERWVSDENGGGHTEVDQAKINRETRNGAKVDAFLDSYIPDVKRVIEDCIAALDLIQKNHVEAFENMDDYHASLAQKLYDKYTSDGQRALDNERKFQKGVKDFGRGAWDSIKGIGIGLFNLGKVGVSAVVVNVAPIFGLSAPDWMSKSVDDFTAGFKGMTGPVDFFTAIGQDFCDSAENEGLAYVAGGLTVEVVSTVVPVGAVGKLKIFEKVLGRGKNIAVLADGTKVELKTFKGLLRGKEVELPNVEIRDIKYIKKDPVEVEALRSKFNTTVRKQFLSDLAKLDDATLESAGLSPADIQRLRAGDLPKGYEVHHKLPLDDSGDNNLDNLILIKKEPYHKVITNFQNDVTKGLNSGDVIKIEWPLPPGQIYSGK